MTGVRADLSIAVADYAGRSRRENDPSTEKKRRKKKETRKSNGKSSGGNCRDLPSIARIARAAFLTHHGRIRARQNANSHRFARLSVSSSMKLKIVGFEKELWCKIGGSSAKIFLKKLFGDSNRFESFPNNRTRLPL